MSSVEVLKFGSSVLRSPDDLPVAVDEIYRHWRSGRKVLAVVSALARVTDQLFAQASQTFGTDYPAATATYVATGEQQTAALLVGSLCRCGLPARMVDPREIGLIADGPSLESTPALVDEKALEVLWSAWPILVLPGFYGIRANGQIALFGRGGSDLSALFLAATLGGHCRLLKDVCVFDADPVSSPAAHRFRALSWNRAIQVAGRLVQPKALHFAHRRSLPFEVGRPNEAACTSVGQSVDEWAAPRASARPLRIALLGCGVVGRGVYESVRRYPQVFDLRHVVVRTTAKYPDIDHLTADLSVALDDSIEVVIVCFGGVPLAHSVIAAALDAGKFVVTANKAAMAAHGKSLRPYARGAKRLLWYSAAVGGALPALEVIENLTSPVREIRGIINGTCGAVLEAWEAGRTRDEAVALAQSRGLAEEDPARDLSGLDSADKLTLLVDAAFGEWLGPEEISTRGIDCIGTEPAGYKLIARAEQTPDGVTASVAPEVPLPGSFLGQASGPENRLEIELTTGEIIRLRGQGAGRWPTTVSVLADLHEIARLLEDRDAEADSVRRSTVSTSPGEDSGADLRRGDASPLR